MASRRGGTEVLQPNLGLYLDRPSVNIPLRGLKDCLNVRVRNGELLRDNMGWESFPQGETALALSGDPVTGLDSFAPRSGGQTLLIMTTRDVYRFDEATNLAVLLTPRYATGTVSVTNASATVTGSGTSWTANLKAGDLIHVGDAAQTDPTATWYEVETVDSNTQVTLTAAYQGATASGAAYTARLVFTGTLLTPWLTESFFNATAVGVGSDGDRWYASNGLDPVIAWGTGLTQVYFPAIGLDRVSFLRKVSNLMVYGNITVSGDPRTTSVRTSDIAKPEDTAGGLATELIIHDTTDPLLAAYRLGDVLVAYGGRTITLMQFVGGDVVFVLRQVASSIGALSARAVADFGDYHEFLGPDGQYRFDGASLTRINDHVWPTTLRTLSSGRLAMVAAHFDEANGELLWVLPQTTDADPDAGAPEQALVEHYLELADERVPTPFTKRELPGLGFGFFERETTLTWDQLTDTWEELNFRWNDSFLQAVFPFVLFGTAAGGVFVLGALDSQNGAAITSFARFGRRQLGSTAVKGTVLRLYPFAREIAGDLTVRLHTARDLAGDTTMASALTYDMSAADARNFVNPRLTARYLEVEFRTAGVSKPFWLSGYDMAVVRAGAR